MKKIAIISAVIAAFAAAFYLQQNHSIRTESNRAPASISLPQPFVHIETNIEPGIPKKDRGRSLCEFQPSPNKKRRAHHAK